MSRRPRVLVVTWELLPDSGWGRYSLGLVRALTERRVDVTVLSERRTAVPDLGVQVVPCLSTPLATLDRPMALVWNTLQVLRHAPGHDLVHFFVEPYALTASVLFPWPYLLTVHGTYGIVPLRMNPVTRMLFARTLRRAAAVVCVSRFTARRVGQELPLRNLAVIANGFEQLKGLATARDASNGPAIVGDPVIMGAGALKPRKGYHVVLEALPRIRERYPNIHYYLVGDDRDRRYVASLRETIDRLSLQANATITGTVPEASLDALYRRADVFVLPPVNSGAAFEGFGLTYLEANAYGKPVVGAYDCGAEDAIEDGVNGYLVPQNDPAAVADRVLGLLDDPQTARTMGERGRERALARDWSHVVDEYLALYGRILTRRGR
ncbi:MAG: glycosyltransferase family 4 protein [Chloroflexi bacterium]|nr:glycosyltransferase family 4 protein [Chloroflexota bacterium]